MTTEGRLHIRFGDSDREMLEALAESLGLDISSTVRFLVKEKCRERGIVRRPVPVRKKARAK